MCPDNKNALLIFEGFPEDAFLIFIGHSDDATAEAHAIYDLQIKLEKDFRTFLKANPQSPFKSFKLWEWRMDASSKTGGQNAVVIPALHRAQITIFVFKERVGAVTWEELENARKRSKNSEINILAFFPAQPPELSKLTNLPAAQDWATLLERKKTLTTDWLDDDSSSVTPCSLYEDIDNLKNIALEKIRDAMREVIADSKCLTDLPKHSISYSAERIIGDIKDISFDRRPMQSHVVDELDSGLVKKFLSQPLSIRVLSKEKRSLFADDAERLAVLGCVTDSHPTLGAFLCFAPSRLITNKYSSCSLHVVRYLGTNRFSSRAEMFPIYDNLLNLFDQGKAWLVSEAHLGRQGRIGSTDRDDLEIPESALREALANALVHRDYEDPLHRDQPTRVEVYDNRVEITSFGTLPGSVNIDQLNQYSEKLTPVRRNPVIAQIFYHMTNVELNASGIARMRYAMQKALLPPPTIKIQNGAVVVCFERPILINSDTNQPEELRKRALIGGALSGLEPFKKETIAACFDAGYFPVMMEHHPVDFKDAISLSNSMVDNADIYIGIFTHQYGYMPDGCDKSIYEIEYSRVKIRKKLPRLLFSLRQNFFDKDLSGNELYSRKQLQFREVVASESDLVNVSSAEELRTKLIDGFKKLADVGTSDDFKSVERYRSVLKEELGYIRMLGLPGVESIKVNLNDDTFVPLRLSDRHVNVNMFSKASALKDNEQILYPDEIMKRAFHDGRGRRMLLVIGDPGAGKTTLLKYYALCALDSERSFRLGFSGLVKVFYLPLRELIRHSNDQYNSLPANLALWSGSNHLSLSQDRFDDWLQSGTSLVLLDGLDEISNTEERKKVCRWIDNAFTGFSKAYFVVTSRATGYRKDEGIELESDYERADVQDFTAEQQERFLRNWFTAAFLKEPCDKGVNEEMWREKQKMEAEKRTMTIVAHLNIIKNKGLRQLAAIPMILQIMAILWKDREYMPESRVELYDVALNYLLEFRDKRRGIKPLLSAIDARMVLGPISLWMQETLKKDEAAKAEMHTKIQEMLDTIDTSPTAEAFCDYLVNRAGLLVEIGGHDYLFRHKSFREYLAGIQLKENRPYDQLNKLVSHFGEDWWEEPLRFFIASVDANVFDAFMKTLFDSPVSDALTQKQQLLLQTIIEEAKGKKIDALCIKLLDSSTTGSRQRVIIDCLKAIGKPGALHALQRFTENRLAKNQDIADRAEEVLLALGGQKSNDEPLRSWNIQGSYQAITTLTSFDLKDLPRLFYNKNEDNAEYILIPAGIYNYSVTGKEVHVRDLYVAKYPVTNNRYRLFIAFLQKRDSDMSDDSQLLLSAFCKELNIVAKNETWAPEFMANLNNYKNNLDTLFVSGFDEDRKFGDSDKPVVGVTWYAARAYCLWLSMLEKETAFYRIPDEVEWEWAAGGKQGTIDQKVRLYPWLEEKGEPDKTLANYNGHEQVTTPVGNYPKGATPEGLYDMAGNVCEWMVNRYPLINDDAYYHRGCSWMDAAEDLKCVKQGYNLPHVKVNFIGFRVALFASDYKKKKNIS